MTEQRINTSFTRFPVLTSHQKSLHRIAALFGLSCTIGLGLIGHSAQAGTFTDAPGALQGDIAIQHQFQVSRDSIYQEESIVGARSLTQQTSSLVMRIGLVDFMSADIRLPMGSETLTFSNIYEMKYDPLSQTGSYLDTPEIEDVTRTGNGLQGTELEIRVISTR